MSTATARDGRVLKADAAEHCRAHDCIGPQDLTWDVVGAAVELDLDETELALLEDRIASASRYRPETLLREFYRVCYLAFQMGYYALAAEAHDQISSTETSRLRRTVEHYSGRLGRCCWHGGSRTCQSV